MTTKKAGEQEAQAHPFRLRRGSPGRFPQLAMFVNGVRVVRRARAISAREMRLGQAVPGVGDSGKYIGVATELEAARSRR